MKKLIDNPHGYGDLYEGNKLIGKVIYSIKVYKDTPDGLKDINGNFNIDTDKYGVSDLRGKSLTLFLLDNPSRKLDILPYHTNEYLTLWDFKGQNDFYT